MILIISLFLHATNIWRNLDKGSLPNKGHNDPNPGKTTQIARENIEKAVKVKSI